MSLKGWIKNVWEDFPPVQILSFISNLPFREPDDSIEKGFEKQKLDASLEMKEADIIQASNSIVLETQAIEPEPEKVILETYNLTPTTNIEEQAERIEPIATPEFNEVRDNEI